MEIINSTIINGELQETSVEEVFELTWQLDETPNFIAQDKRFKTSKEYREKRFNRYEHFTKFINAMYPNAKNILDVGTGNSESSILLKKLGYNVTAMDIFNFFQIAVLNHHQINYIINHFDLKTDIQDYDLVTGLHCCTGIEKIIRNCLYEDKEFVVTICEKNQGLYQTKPNNTRKEYIEYLKNISSKIKMTKLPIYDLNEEEYFGETIYYKKSLK